MIGLLLACVISSCMPTLDPEPPPSCGCERWVQRDGGYECVKPARSCPAKKKEAGRTEGT